MGLGSRAVLGLGGWAFGSSLWAIILLTGCLVFFRPHWLHAPILLTLSFSQRQSATGQTQS